MTMADNWSYLFVYGNGHYRLLFLMPVCSPHLNIFVVHSADQWFRHHKPLPPEATKDFLSWWFDAKIW